MIRALIVDDDGFVRWSLSQILGQCAEIEVVGDVEDGSEAVAAVRAHRPDVVLMDLRMGKLNGIEATALISALPDAPAVLMMTAFEVGSDEVLRALWAGAAGFVYKDGPPGDDLADQVIAAANGEAPLSPRLTRHVVERVAAEPQRRLTAQAQATMSKLTPRERDVARLVAEGLSNAEIAERLYVSESTVKSHLNTAMTKAAAPNRARLAALSAIAEIADLDERRPS